MQYSFWIGVKKAIINIVIVGAPLAVTLLPEMWQNITLSGVVLLIVNFLKVRYSLGAKRG